MVGERLWLLHKQTLDENCNEHNDGDGGNGDHKESQNPGLLFLLLCRALESLLLEPLDNLLRATGARGLLRF